MLSTILSGRHLFRPVVGILFFFQYFLFYVNRKLYRISTKQREGEQGVSVGWPGRRPFLEHESRENLRYRELGSQVLYGLDSWENLRG